MRKVISIIFNDAHLKDGNEEEVLTSCNHMVKYATDNGIKNLIFAGDFFDSRSAQRLKVLKTFEKILDNIHNAGLTLYLFAGNHDKTLYSSEESFLDAFKFHPCVIFNSNISDIEIEGKKITLLPFFDDEILVPIIEKHNGGDVLISHFEMYGSEHLGKKSEKVEITAKMLSKWKRTYLGHYHNTHEITPAIVHLPSLRQNSYGENNNKGFTLLYDDLSYEIVKGVFKEYKKIKLNIDGKTKVEINNILKKYELDDRNLRFEVYGDENSLRSLDLDIFKSKNIDAKKMYSKKFEEDVKKVEIKEPVKKYDSKNILVSLKEFCDLKDYDFNKGSEIIKNFIKNG